MYIIITNPDSYDCGIEKVKNLTDALRLFAEYNYTGLRPILTQELLPILGVIDLDGKTVSLPLE